MGNVFISQLDTSCERGFIVGINNQEHALYNWRGDNHNYYTTLNGFKALYFKGFTLTLFRE